MVPSLLLYCTFFSQVMVSNKKLKNYVSPSHLANPLLGLEKVNELLQLEEVGLVAAEERRLVLVQA